MSINSSSINSSSINSSANSTIDETVTESLLITNTESETIVPAANESVSESLVFVNSINGIGFVPLVDSLIITDTISSLLGDISVIENLLLNDLATSGMVAKETVTELIDILDQFSLIFTSSAIDTLTLLDTLSSILSRIETVLEALTLVDSSSSISAFISFLVDSISLLELISPVPIQSVTESLILTETIQGLYSALGSVIESLVVTDDTSSNYTYVVSLNNDITFSDSIASTTSFLNTLTEELFFIIKDKEDDRYSTYLFSPETSYVSTYSNYNFDSATKFGDKYLFSNSTGLYEYGSSLDNLTDIVAHIITSSLSFGTSNLKQLPQLYLGLSSNEEVYLKVRVDGKAEANYKLNKRTSELQTQKIAIGKGLIGKYFQFELVSSATQFNLDSIDFYPVELKRKL